MIKLATTALIATVALAAATPIAPTFAVDPGANPAGKWVCLVDGTAEPAGKLTMAETAYSFIQTDTQSSSQGTYRIDRGVISVTSGPLEDELGFGHGYFNSATSQLAVTFHRAAGRGMACSRDVDL